MIADYEFDDGERIFQNALPIANTIAALKARASGRHTCNLCQRQLRHVEK
jgi:hypothetical protein